jgi:hypothetical protein
MLKRREGSIQLKGMAAVEQSCFKAYLRDFETCIAGRDYNGKCYFSSPKINRWE